MVRCVRVLALAVLMLSCATASPLGVARRALRAPTPPALFTLAPMPAGDASGTQPRAQANVQDDVDTNQATAARLEGQQARLLQLNDDVLDSDAAEVTVALLQDLDVVVVWDSDKEAGQIKKLRSHIKSTQEDLGDEERVTMTGTLKGYDEGETLVTFVVSQESFFGTVQFPEVQPTGDVVTRSIKIKSLPGEAHAGIVYEHFTPDLPELELESPTAAHDAAQEPDDSTSVMSAVSSNESASASPVLAADGRRRLQQSNTIIDVLMLYTPAASRALGGDRAIVDEITSLMALNNRILQNSQLNVQLRLVKVQKVDYSENGDMERSLDDLTDGNIRGVHSLRTQVGADLVQLFTTDAGFCGIAWLGGGRAKGYSVVATKCILGHTSIHEFGHNFGCDHDYYDSRSKYSGLSRCDMSSRAQWFSTVMSYGCENGARPATIFHLSNPNVMVSRSGSSFPTGDSRTADCALSVRNTAPRVAAYMESTTSGGVDKHTCPGGGVCQSPNVCASYKGTDVCCSENYPVWCGGDTCHRDGYQCPGSKVDCPSGGSCTSPNVCASYQGSDVCCSADYPVWCGGEYCHEAGHQCPESKVTCPGGGYCTAPQQVCASYKGTDVCCTADYPVWCGGNSCHRASHQC